MRHTAIPGSLTPLPRPPGGWFDYGYAVLWNGELALLRTDYDNYAELARRQGAGAQSDDQQQDLEPSGARLRLSVFDGANESAAIEVPAGRRAMADRFPDGRWLLVTGRPGLPAGTDGQLYSADGAPVGSFDVGSYATHVQCAIDGTIWAGYFDASVLAVDTSISSAGLARFDGDGRLLWRLKDREDRNPLNDDCDALTVDGATVWSCFSAGYPIIRIERGVVRRWHNEVVHAGAIAVDGDHVLLAGGHGEDRSRISLVRLEGDEAHEVSTVTFRRPDPKAARLLQGRGATLHIVGDGNWRRISVATMLEGRVHN